MMSVQSNMAYFIRYAHFQGNNLPWPADFGSTPCNVSNRNLDLSIPNTITSYCTTLFITTLSNYTCVIAQLHNVLPAHSSCISVWYMKSTSETHVVVNGGCCGYMASWPVLPASLVMQLCMSKSPVQYGACISSNKSILPPPWCRLLPQFIRNHRNSAIESQSRSKWLGM